jgi:hypothetical protein
VALAVLHPLIVHRKPCWSSLSMCSYAKQKVKVRTSNIKGALVYLFEHAVAMVLALPLIQLLKWPFLCKQTIMIVRHR